MKYSINIEDIIVFFRRLSNENAALTMIEFLTDKGYEEYSGVRNMIPGMYRVRILQGSRGISKYLFSIKPKEGETFFTGKGDVSPAPTHKRLKYKKKLIPV